MHKLKQLTENRMCELKFQPLNNLHFNKVICAPN